MRIIVKCPKCGGPIQRHDTVCMNCSADLIQAELEKKQALQEDAVAARRAAEVAGGGNAGGAAAGRAAPDESSKETRMRIFDEQEAERLTQERLSCYVTAGLVALPAVALLTLGILRLQAVGLAEIGTLNLADLRTWAALGDARVITIVAVGLGLAGSLACLGLTHRAVGAGRAILQVKLGERPTIVSLALFTYWGLLLTALFCPPLGLIIGTALKFSSDEDIKGAGGTMIIVSLVVLGVLVINALLSLAEGLKSPAPAAQAPPATK